MSALRPGEPVKPRKYEHVKLLKLLIQASLGSAGSCALYSLPSQY